MALALSEDVLLPVQPGAWPADKVSRRRVAELVPFAQNARTHTPEQVAQIASSIREWGWTNPVLVDETDVIIAGHGRVLAAQRLGLPDCPVAVARGWTDAQKRAYRIADNKLALNAGWDHDLLTEQLAQLRDAGSDIELIGFSQAEISALLAPDSNPYDEWTGMPVHDQSGEKAYLTLMVHFKDEAAVAEFSQLVGQDIRKTQKRAPYIWFPPKPEVIVTADDEE